VEKGSFVCEATYWNKVPRAKHWYTPSLLKTVARLQFVIDPNLCLEAESNVNKLPNQCDKRQARKMGARRVRKEVHASNLDEIIRRDTLGYDAPPSDDEEGSSDESDEEQGTADDSEVD
jgi:hypothetical protein